MNANLINANAATIMTRLYQLKAEQDGKNITVIAHAERREPSCTHAWRRYPSAMISPSSSDAASQR